MATLSIPDQNLVIEEAGAIQERLAAIGIDYERWDLLPGVGPSSSNEEILSAYADRITAIKEKGGYTTVDVVNVHRETPGLDTMLAKFSTEHWHDEDEVRFTLHGRGIYHVHSPNGSVLAVEVGAGDMIRVPRGTLHWFNLCSTREILTIRFFQDAGGWTPYYTQSGLDGEYEPVCLGPAYFPVPPLTTL